MTTKSGRIASVRINATKVTGQGTWTLSGFTREVIEEDSWDLDIKKKYFSVGDAGMITFSGLHDPEDGGQIALDAACLASTSFDPGQLRFYVNAANYWSVKAGGQMKVTKCESITLEKSAMGTVDFEVVVSGAEMEYT